MDAQSRTGIVAALPGEARTARPLARMGWRIRVGGVGAEAARSAVTSMLDSGAERLLVWGTAAALRPDLGPGAVIVPGEVRDGDGRRYAPAQPWQAQLRSRVPAGITVDVGTLITTARPVAGCAAKTALARATGGVAVDMETAIVARLAAERGVPFAAVRAIVDPLATALPQVVSQGLPERRVALAVMLRLAAHPRDAPGVFVLARHMHAARRSLAATARGLAET